MSTSSKQGGGQKEVQGVSLNEDTMEELTNRFANVKKELKPRRTKNEWRSIFAFILLCGFLAIVGFIVIADQVWGAHTPAADLLSTVGTIIASPLSFVIGYYYNKEKNS